MFVANDMLKLSEMGLKKYGSRFNDADKFFISKVICETHEYTQYFIVTCLTSANLNSEPTQPLCLTFKKVKQFFQQALDEEGCGLFYIHHELTRLADSDLESIHPKWLAKRNRDLSLISDFIAEDLILKYLRGELGQQIAQHARIHSVNNKALRRALNRYISFGCRENALLPIRYANVGKAPRNYTKKPGPKNKSPSALSTRVIEAGDEAKVRRLALQNCVDKKDGRFSVKRLHLLYLKQYCSVKKITTTQAGKHLNLVIDKSKEINYQQFKRLFNKAFDSSQQQVLKKGKAAFNNNRKDKTGNATEGVFRAAQLCESDSTELPIYVAYPLNPDKREAAGKVNLCIVVCVKTQLIMGYSLSFSSPSWNSVAEALINCVQDKRIYAAQYNVDLEEADWPSQHFPEALRVDNGGENSTKMMQQVIESGVGINVVDYCPPASGAKKGTVENLLRVLQDFLPNLTGSVEKGRDAGIQHPSQKAVFQIEDIHRFIIHAIKIHNTLDSRVRLLTTEMCMDDITPTPSAMWCYLMEDEFYGRPKISQKRIPELINVLMPRAKATVSRNEVKLNGLGYYSSWAEKKGWFLKAAEQRFPIELILLGGLVDIAYYKDESGELQQFELKKEYEQYRGMTEHQVKFRQAEIKEQEAMLNHHKANARINLENEIEQAEQDRLTNDFKDAPPNTQKTIQKGIAKRKEIMAAEEQKQKAKQLLSSLNSRNVLKSDDIEQDDDDFGEGVIQ